MSHGLDPMPPRRAVVSWMPDPSDRFKRIYELDCGHFVSRRTRGDKREACCGTCPPETGRDARDWRNPLGAASQ